MYIYINTHMHAFIIIVFYYPWYLISTVALKYKTHSKSQNTTKEARKGTYRYLWETRIITEFSVCLFNQKEMLAPYAFGLYSPAFKGFSGVHILVLMFWNVNSISSTTPYAWPASNVEK